MPPEQIWLMLIPLFNLIWHFILIDKIAVSLQKEFSRRSLPVEPEPGKQIGLVMCILAAMTVIPFIGYLTGVGAVVCWIVYWNQISSLSNRIAMPYKG